MSDDRMTEPPQSPAQADPAATVTQSLTAAAAPPADAAVPPELAAHPRYRIVRLIGAGGMGTVYQAEHRVMERAVALKVVRADLLNSASSIERFRREVKAAAQLHHPHIVTAFDAEQAGNAHFLVMEFVEGDDLARYVANRGPLPVAEACRYIRQAALGLQHALEKGVCHRDIKPSNLMRTLAGEIKIMDFGLARFAGGGSGGQTSSGVILGTIDFMAPEQADNARVADTRSDIYSLGCTLFYLLTGRVMFPDGTLVQRVMCHVEKPPPPISDLRADVPPALVDVLAKMLAKDPSRRYQSPAEVADAVAPFTGEPTISAFTSAPPSAARASAQPDSWDDEFEPRRPATRLRPHRGVLVMTLGIISVVYVLVSFLLCAPFSVFTLAISVPTWIMAARDRRAIRDGRMDPQGAGMTLTGYVCAIVGTAAGVIASLCWLIFFGAIFGLPAVSKVLR